MSDAYRLNKPVPDHRRFELDARLGLYSHICCVRSHALELHELANQLNPLELEVLYDSICCPGGDVVPNDVPNLPTPPTPPTPSGAASDCIMRFLTYACSPPGQAAIRAFVAHCDDYLALNLSLDADKLVVTIGRSIALALLDSCGDPAKFKAGATLFCTWFRDSAAWLRANGPRLSPERVRVLTILFGNPLLTGYLVDCCR